MGLLQQGFSPVLMFYLLCPYTAAAQAASCDVSTYGKPEKRDCLTLFEKFTSSQNLQTRFFDEEQLRVDSDNTWPGVANVFEQPIVQLPRFYAMNTCNFALMPYTNPATRLANPLDISSWGIIKSYGNSLMQDCLEEKSAGGEIFIKSSTSMNPVLVIFMWASGANFETKLNQYENDPSFSPQLSLAEGGVNGTDGDGIRVA
ncbi:hypothetical protein HO173_003594 [Letharia columbiana]|uniref:Uncharacterized protein n=1 Tax=Letharia columbiana TaxID=112416 RepID=A0A8H6G0P7_9LECA|nr:uncharacterized protein HO173_003594 [Letharia columbiana]KAF6238314.1 hypothetical protein HO173_003594 [Letharia columbiana]